MPQSGLTKYLASGKVQEEDTNFEERGFEVEADSNKIF